MVGLEPPPRVLPSTICNSRARFLIPPFPRGPQEGAAAFSYGAGGENVRWSAFPSPPLQTPLEGRAIPAFPFGQSEGRKEKPPGAGRGGPRGEAPEFWLATGWISP